MIGSFVESGVLLAGQFRSCLIPDLISTSEKWLPALSNVVRMTLIVSLSVWRYWTEEWEACGFLFGQHGLVCLPRNSLFSGAVPWNLVAQRLPCTSDTDYELVVGASTIMAAFVRYIVTSTPPFGVGNCGGDAE